MRKMAKIINEDISTLSSSSTPHKSFGISASPRSYTISKMFFVVILVFSLFSSSFFIHQSIQSSVNNNNNGASSSSLISPSSLEKNQNLNIQRNDDNKNNHHHHHHLQEKIDEKFYLIKKSINDNNNNNNNNNGGEDDIEIVNDNDIVQNDLNEIKSFEKNKNKIKQETSRLKKTSRKNNLQHIEISGNRNNKKSRTGSQTFNDGSVNITTSISTERDFSIIIQPEGKIFIKEDSKRKRNNNKNQTNNNQKRRNYIKHLGQPHQEQNNVEGFNLFVAHHIQSHRLQQHPQKHHQNIYFFDSKHRKKPNTATKENVWRDSFIFSSPLKNQQEQQKPRRNQTAADYNDKLCDDVLCDWDEYCFVEPELGIAECLKMKMETNRRTNSINQQLKPEEETSIRTKNVFGVVEYDKSFIKKSNKGNNNNNNNKKRKNGQNELDYDNLMGDFGQQQLRPGEQKKPNDVDYIEDDDFDFGDLYYHSVSNINNQNNKINSRKPNYEHSATLALTKNDIDKFSNGASKKRQEIQQQQQQQQKTSSKLDGRSETKKKTKKKKRKKAEKNTNNSNKAHHNQKMDGLETKQEYKLDTVGERFFPNQIKNQEQQPNSNNNGKNGSKIIQCPSCPFVHGQIVCGTDNSSYSSMCRIEFHNCIHETKVKFACFGYCPCAKTYNNNDNNNNENNDGNRELQTTLITEKYHELSEPENVQITLKRNNSTSTSSSSQHLVLTGEDLNQYYYVQDTSISDSNNIGKKEESASESSDHKTMKQEKKMEKPKEDRSYAYSCSSDELRSMGFRLLDWFSVVMKEELKRKTKQLNNKINNNDNTTTDATILSLQQQKYLPDCEEAVSFMFYHFDTDHNYKLSSEELFYLKHDENEHCLEPYLNQCDEDHNDFLSTYEWCSCFSLRTKPCLYHQKHITRNQNMMMVGQYVPQCDENGRYQNVQCHSSSNYCWCSDKNGNEIAGTRVRGRLAICDKRYPLDLEQKKHQQQERKRQNGIKMHSGYEDDDVKETDHRLQKKEDDDDDDGDDNTNNNEKKNIIIINRPKLPSSSSSSSFYSDIYGDSEDDDDDNGSMEEGSGLESF